MSSQNVLVDINDVLLKKALQANYPNLVDLLKDANCREEIRQLLATGYPFIKAASPALMKKIWDEIEQASILRKKLTQPELDLLFDVHAQQIETLEEEVKGLQKECERLKKESVRDGYSLAGH
jgi:hypothetical protein